LYALGLVGRVGDLDLVFPSADRHGLPAAIGDLVDAPLDFGAPQEAGFSSDWRCLAAVEGQDLDLTGGLVLEVAGIAVRLPFRDGGRWDLDGVSIPLAPVEQWLLIYRVHDPGRSRLLGAAVDPAAWQAMCLRLGLPAEACALPGGDS
jgi:hypothetical protein